MAFLFEAQLETALVEQLAGLGYVCASNGLGGPIGYHGPVQLTAGAMPTDGGSE
jgi:hypothetical protein